MSDHIGIKVPVPLAEQAERIMQSSGITSLSELNRHLLREYIDKAKDPKERTKSDRMAENTAGALFPQWMTNFRKNLDDIDQGRDIIQLAEKYQKKKTALIIGAGPSLEEYRHLEMLAKSNYDGLVIATDRILISCLEKGVIPDMVVSLDGDFEVCEFLKHDLIKKHCGKMDMIFSTVVDNTTINMWPRKDNIYFFNPHLDTMETDMSVSKAMLQMTGKTVMHTGGNVGGASWFLAVMLKKGTIGLIGMDLSYKDTKDIEDLPSFPIFSRMHEGNPDKIIKCFRRDTHPFFKTVSIPDYMMDAYLEVFQSWTAAIHDAHGVMTVNCTGSGTIHPGKGIECMHFQDFLKKHAK